MKILLEVHSEELDDITSPQTFVVTEGQELEVKPKVKITKIIFKKVLDAKLHNSVKS